ncbi:S41 family peptidase [Chitinophaga barathri]|uniref:Peptidase S41 n=1 Tax=Chitinophaga barathri TaxID=1647451 RepID=A0A3N4M4V0_9BACT|nr:S41 family peptidase [Chitinophaga barathri]RPD38181.1 peptidase S41 [Chitinophaga barathri]
MPTDSIGRVNKWVLDSMKRYYYWSDHLPNHPDYTLSPPDFFSSLLVPQDRFSWISDARTILPPGNAYFSYGLHYAFISLPGYTDGLVGVATFVNQGSAAAKAGLVRGSCFIKVDGNAVTAQNLEAVNTRMNGHGATPLRITPAVWDNGVLTPGAEKSLAADFGMEEGVLYTRSFTENRKITGYLYYGSFNEAYDSRLITAFQKLRNAGVNELILDLRYNAGGSVASSAKLAAMIASGLKATDNYAIYAGNAKLGKAPRTLQAVLNTSGNAVGRNYSQLQTVQLNLQRVFILTTKGTVSAAELIINNLKPYLQVIQIGETTMGKDEAAFLMQQAPWQIQPTVYKLFNASNQGDYSNGLVPQHRITELATLPLAELGTTNEPLTAAALGLIYEHMPPAPPVQLRRVPVKLIYDAATEQARHASPVIIH